MTRQSDEEKLGILLAHWVEHNEAHAREFRVWAERASQSGRKAVHDRILEAALQMSRLNELLLDALQELKES
jgi:hypothetical protein